jgi:hypothetical protein
MAFEFPVDPTLDQEGRLQALVPLLPTPESARPVELKPLDGVWDFDFNSRSGSTGAYAQLGVSSAFTSNSSMESRTLVWDALIGKRVPLENPTPSSVIFETFWGVGLRVVVTFKTVDSTADVNIGTLAAKAEYKGVDVQYEVHSMGLGTADLATLLRKVPPLNGFDMTTYSLLDEVRGTLVKQLGNVLSGDLVEARKKLRPALVKLSLSPFTDDFDEAATYRFTLERIEAGLTLPQMLEQLGSWKNVTEAGCTKVFRELAGASDVPDESARTKARDWLRVG